MPSLKLKALKPAHMPTGADYEKAFQQGAQKSAALVLRDLESTTRTWKHKPAFDVTITHVKGDYIVAAGTDSDIYQYVDEGTKAHVIRPKRSRYLRFSSGYKAKTRVGIIGSQSGGAFGNPAYASIVYHPGFPGRKFTVLIAKRRQKTVEQEIDHSVARVARNQK